MRVQNPPGGWERLVDLEPVGPLAGRALVTVGVNDEDSGGWRGGGCSAR